MASNFDEGLEPRASGPNIAPAPQFPERQGNVYERKMAPDAAGGRGPLRFEEGIATDTDVPSDFALGVMQGYQTPPGQPNHNLNVFEKWPEETLRQRAHMGSAAWVEAPTFLGEFAHGSYADADRLVYEEVFRNGARQERGNPATVID